MKSRYDAISSCLLVVVQADHRMVERGGWWRTEARIYILVSTKMHPILSLGLGDSSLFLAPFRHKLPHTLRPSDSPAITPRTHLTFSKPPSKPERVMHLTVLQMDNDDEVKQAEDHRPQNEKDGYAESHFHGGTRQVPFYGCSYFA